MHLVTLLKLSRPSTYISRSSGLSLDYPDTFLIYLDTFRIIRKDSRLFRHISGSPRLSLDYPDTFSKLSGHFLHRPETLQLIQTLFRSSRHFPVNPDSWHIIWIFCIVFGANDPEILQPIINLPQKISGLAMVPCYL